MSTNYCFETFEEYVHEMNTYNEMFEKCEQYRQNTKINEQLMKGIHEMFTDTDPDSNDQVNSELEIKLKVTDPKCKSQWSANEVISNTKIECEHYMGVMPVYDKVYDAYDNFGICDKEVAEHYQQHDLETLEQNTFRRIWCMLIPIIEFMNSDKADFTHKEYTVIVYVHKQGMYDPQMTYIYYNMFCKNHSNSFRDTYTKKQKFEKMFQKDTKKQHYYQHMMEVNKQMYEKYKGNNELLANYFKILIFKYRKLLLCYDNIVNNITCQNKHANEVYDKYLQMFNPNNRNVIHDTSNEEIMKFDASIGGVDYDYYEVANRIKRSIVSDAYDNTIIRDSFDGDNFDLLERNCSYLTDSDDEDSYKHKPKDEKYCDAYQYGAEIIVDKSNHKEAEAYSKARKLKVNSNELILSLLQRIDELEHKQ